MDRLRTGVNGEFVMSHFHLHRPPPKVPGGSGFGIASKRIFLAGRVSRRVPLL